MTRWLRLTISGLLVLPGATVATSALASNEDKEQCAGIAKAGKNDCATATNACHGQVESDANPNAWIYVPKGTCERLVGARVVTINDPTTKKQ